MRVHLKIVTGVILSVVAIAAIILSVIISREPRRQAEPSVVVPPAGEIVLKGGVLCLPHKDSEGPQTLECAFGVKDDEGRYFGLRDPKADYSTISALRMGVRYEISGMFEPREDERYQSIGTILIASAEIADVPKEFTIEGTYTCLVDKSEDGVSEGCPPGLSDAWGEEYALHLDNVAGGSTVLHQGDKLRISGTLVAIELVSSDQWQKYGIKGIIDVKEIAQVEQ